MYDVALFHWLVQNIETPACLTRHNQENAQWSPDPFPRQGWKLTCMSSVLESELGQRWKCGALKACIG